MTPTTDELRALIYDLEWPKAVYRNQDDTIHPTLFKVVAALRQWIAERERADALANLCKDANEAAMKHWPCNNPDRSDV